MPSPFSRKRILWVDDFSSNHETERSERSGLRLLREAAMTEESTVVCNRTVKVQVVALDQPWMWNRLGAAQPGGMIYALYGGSVASLELRRSLAIASAKLDRHRAEQIENEAME